MGLYAADCDRLLWAGYELNRLGRFAEARNAFEKLLSEQPDYAFALAGEVKALTNLGQADEAEGIKEALKRLTQKRTSLYSMGQHDPLAHFFYHFTCEKYRGLDLGDYLDLRQQAVKDLIRYYSNSSCGPEVLSGYNLRELQEAYILRYFPHYIEPTYHELTSILVDPLFNRQSRDISVCYYGCGPAPEYLGVAHFISEHLTHIGYVNSYFFEKNSWDWARAICTGRAVADYVSRDEITFKEKHNIVDLNTLVDSGQFDNYPEISLAKVHVFQNCLRDLEGEAGSSEVVRRVLTNTLHHMSEGSLMVIIDLNYTRTRSLLERFINDAENSSEGIIIRETVSDPVRVESKIERAPEYRRFEQQIGMKKTGTNYCSVILARV